MASQQIQCQQGMSIPECLAIFGTEAQCVALMHGWRRRASRTVAPRLFCQPNLHAPQEKRQRPPPQPEDAPRVVGLGRLRVTDEAIAAWAATRRAIPGGQAAYSDSAIQTGLMRRAASKFPLRQAKGLMLSVVELLGCALAVPGHTPVSRRAAGLQSITRGLLPGGPLHVLIDSTEWKVYGAGQWQIETHGRLRRTWRKLHLGADACNGQIVRAIEQVTADDAYDGEPTHQTITAHGTAIAEVISPSENAVPIAGFETDPSPHDGHLLTITPLGRLGGQAVTGYGKRALVGAAMGRDKGLIGERLRWRGGVQSYARCRQAQRRPLFGGAGVSS